MTLPKNLKNAIRVILCIPVLVGLFVILEGLKSAMSDPGHLENWKLLIFSITGYILYMPLCFLLAKWLNREDDRPGQLLNDNSTGSPSASADNERILELARANPPQCLNSFILKQNSPLLEQLKITDTEIAYQLECSCGGTHFKLHGFRYPERERNGNISFLAPIVAVCARCGRESSVFDDDKDGYDARIDFQSERSDPHEPRMLDGEFQLAVSFEHSMTDDEIPDFPELTNGHGGDYFTWITVYGQKDGEEPQNLFDWECA